MEAEAPKTNEFPKMVYKPGLKDPIVIETEEGRPEGYFDHAEAKAMDAAPEPEADDEKLAAEQAKLEAAQADRQAKLAEKDYRKGIFAYLEEHNVKFAKNMSTSDLEDLKVKLDEHLAAQESKDDNEQ